MESWHGTKINNYLTIKTIIESKGWCVEIFAVEIRAKECCTKSVLCYLKKLGFNNKPSETLLKVALLQIFYGMLLFCIWVARNNKEWTSSAANGKRNNDSSKKTQQFIIYVIA